MNIISRLRNAGRAVFGRAVEASLPTGVLEFMSRHGKTPDVSQDALVRKYFGWTYSCANVSATRFASTPLKLYASRATGQTSVKNFRTKPVNKDESKRLRSRLGKSLAHVAGAEDFEELEDHPLLTMLQNANDQENGFEIKELTCLMLDLTGNGYWLIERNRLGVPTKFFCLRSQWVRIIPDKLHFVKGYYYGYNNAWGYDTRLDLGPDDVIHFKYPNPLDPWYGLGPVQAAAYSIQNAEEREKFMLATMSNMARPDLVVKYLEGELDPNERRAVEMEWNAMFRGSKNAGKVKVTDFRYEIDKVGWNPSELDFNRGEDWILKKICSAFPVPLGLVDSSQISRAPRSGMEGSDLFMAQFNTLPRCTRFEEKLNERLTPMYDDRLFLAFDNPVPKDKVQQNAEDVQRLNTQQVTINEIRKRNGEDPVEWGDVPLVGPGISPLGSTTAPQLGPDGTPITPASPDSAGIGSPGGEPAQMSPEQAMQAVIDGKLGEEEEGDVDIPGQPVKKARLFSAKGGEGSGIVGHTTPKQEAAKRGVLRDIKKIPPEELQDIQSQLTQWANKHGVAGAKDQAQVFRNMLRGYSIEEAIDKRNARVESEMRRNIGDELFEQWKEDGSYRPLPKPGDAPQVDSPAMAAAREGMNADLAAREADRPGFEADIRSGKKGMEVGSDEAGGYAIEMDGGALHPTLAGVPVKVRKVRNEAGRFDRRDPDKVRATRSAARTLLGKK